MLTDIPENYLPLTKAANSSKGDLPVAVWIAAREAKGRGLPQEKAEALREADIRARDAINARFNEYLPP